MQQFNGDRCQADYVVWKGMTSHAEGVDFEVLQPVPQPPVAAAMAVSADPSPPPAPPTLPPNSTLRTCPPKNVPPSNASLVGRCLTTLFDSLGAPKEF